MQIPRISTPDDFPLWLSLAKEVEHLFGLMSDVPEFQKALASAIANSTAFCISDPHENNPHQILGGVVISTETNAIEWLAVSKIARGKGYGRELLQIAIEHLNPSRPIYVQTFASDSAEGTPARHLYQEFGFIDHEPKDPTPTGIPTILMIKPNKHTAA